MPSFTIDAPNGKSYTIEGENADGALDALKQHLGTAGDEPKKAAPSWSDAVTDIPSEIGNAANEALTNIKGVANRSEKGPVEGLLSTGKAVLGVPQLLMSPITGAARSILGHGLEQATHAGGMLINPELASKEDRQAHYEAAKGDVDTALAGLASRGMTPRAPTVPAPVSDLAAASDRLAASGNPVDVPRAIASDSMVAQRTGQAIRNIPVVGDAIPKATARLGGQLEEATSNIASDLGGGSGPNVAHSIGQTIGTAAEQETAAARAAAQQSDQAVLADWDRSVHGANEAVAGIETGARDRAQAAVGNMSPQDMGETLVARLRQGEQDARATKDRLYGISGESDAAVTADSVRGVHDRVSAALDDAGRAVDAQLTPAANRMMQELRGFSDLRIPNRVGPEAPNPVDIAAVDARGMEQTRKRLSNMSQAATNDADRAASRLIMRQFDEWQGDAYENALFSGSQEGLQAVRDARAANTTWRQRFYNDRDDADRVINRIVTGEVTPQEVSNYILGASKVGAKGVSSRLLTRITEATGGDPEAMNAIRGGVWNKLSETTEGTTAKPPAKTANDIMEFLNGSGRDVAQRLFTDSQRSIMRTYADTLQRGIEARGAIADVAANTRPSPMEVGIGPLQRLANDVLGKGGVRSDEALYAAINSYAKSGARSDVNLLSRILQAVPEKDRSNLAGAMVRDMGISPRTGQFSPDVFVSAWGTYKPEAKALLFGMSGPQRVALDDIAAISLRMKEIGSKFGNPSGTAQNANFLALAGSFMAAPLTTIAAGVGGAVAAKMLSSPVGALSVSKWSKAYERVANLPSVANVDNFKRATSLLAININRDTGMPIRDLMQKLQGPVPATADSEKQ